MQFLDVKTDYAFKKVFGSETSKDTLISFLNALVYQNKSTKIADLVISRAGGITIAELASFHKPIILVPSPNVAEDHQTKNAMELVNANAAIMVKDSQTSELLFKKAFEVLNDKNLLEQLKKNITYFAKPDAAQNIAKIILNNC